MTQALSACTGPGIDPPFQNRKGTSAGVVPPPNHKADAGKASGDFGNTAAPGGSTAMQAADAATRIPTKIDDEDAGIVDAGRR